MSPLFWLAVGAFFFLAFYCQDHSQPWVTPALYISGITAAFLALVDLARGHK